jgi:hypothetical protein
MALCTKCKVEKAESDFSKRGEKRRSQCKACCNAWYASNREKLLPYKKQYYQANKHRVAHYPSQDPERRSEYGKQYRLAHKEDTVKRNAKFRELHPGYQNEWRQKNLDSVRCYVRQWHRDKRQNDFAHRLLDNTRRRLRSALDGKTKSKRTLEVLGCSPEFLKFHLESQFRDGMSWANYGKWEIDHIIPCAAFDFSKEDDLLKCFHFTNLQPLWATDNRKKSDKLLEINGSPKNSDNHPGRESSSDSIYSCADGCH